MDREKLKEILLGHKKFFHDKCVKLLAQNVDITKLTYRDTNKITDEYIDTIIEFTEQIDSDYKETLQHFQNVFKEILDGQFMVQPECQPEEIPKD